MVRATLPITEVSRAAASQLAGLGFRKRSGDVFTRNVTDDLLGWIGLNRAVARGDGILEINPVIGARHQPLERLVAELAGRPFHPYIPPTASMHVGYLMPEHRYVPWLFARDGVEAGVRRMVQAILDAGLPFIEQNASLDRLVATLESGGGGVPEQTAYRLPVGYLLLGDVQRAQRSAEQSLTALGERSDPAAEAFRSFASHLRRRLHGTAPEQGSRSTRER